MKIPTSRHVLAALTSMILLGGCANLVGQQHPHTHYLLTDPGPVTRVAQPRPGTLLVREMEASAFYQVDRLAYSRTPSSRNHYEYADWIEPPARRLTWLLRQRLEAAGVFATVAPLAAGVRGDYQLNTRLIDFYHDASEVPGMALLVLEAELVRRADASLVARRIFLDQEPVTRPEAAAAAEAMSRLSHRVLEDMTRWLAQTK